MIEPPPSVFDEPWKDAIETMLPHFMWFYFPRIAALIDWNKPIVFKDKELQKLFKNTGKGRKYVDKLVQVTLRDGKEEWILIHIEVQGDRDPDFPKRLFVYNYRIFEVNDRTVVSLAVLGDLDPTWRPASYGYGHADARMRLDFPIAKLLDIEQEHDLETHENPFALLTLAHLAAKRTRSDLDQRAATKYRLLRSALRKGFGETTIFNLMKFIDWVITLPEELDNKIELELNQEVEGDEMTYIPSFVRSAHREGVREGVRVGEKKGKTEGEKKGRLEGKREFLSSLLEQRFGSLPDWARGKLASANETTLESWSRGLFNETSDLEQFFRTK